MAFLDKVKAVHPWISIQEDRVVAMLDEFRKEDIPWTGGHIFGENGSGVDAKFFGASSGSYMLWDEDKDSLDFVNARQNWTTTGLAITDAAGNARQLYGQFTADSIADSEHLCAIQLRASWAGTADETTEGLTCAEFKARAANGGITNTLGQARAVVGNVDCKKATFTIGHIFEAQADIASGGEITTLKGFRASLNNSGTVGTSYAFIVETANDALNWDYGLYMPAGSVDIPIVVNVVDKSGASLSAVQANAVLDGPTGYYYGLQSNIEKSGTDGIDDCTAVTAYLLQKAGNFTVTGRFAPLQVLISGDGTVGTITKTGTGAVHAAWIANRGTQINTDSILCVHNQSAATATSAIELDIGGTVTYAVDFQGTVSDGWTTGDLTGADEYAAFDQYVLIPVRVKGVTPTLYLMAAETWKAVSI